MEKKMKNLYKSKFGYYPQIDVSGKDVLNLAKKELPLGIEDKELIHICKLFNLLKVPDYNNLAVSSAFLNNINKDLKKYNIGANDLLYAFPDSEGTIVIDGNKYKNVGSPHLWSVKTIDDTIGIAIFSIIEKKLKKNKDLLESMKEKAKTEKEYRDIASMESNLNIDFRFANFFATHSNVISEECKKLILTKGVEKIVHRAIVQCEHLTSVSFPDTLKIIGHEAFWGCSHLDNVKIPGNVKVIGDSAFENCSNLKDVTIEKGVTSIGDYAFYDCNLQSINIPGSVKRVGDSAFCANHRLENVNIKEGVEVIGEGAFANKIIKDIKLPNSIKILEGEPFNKNSTFKSVDKTTTYVPRQNKWNTLREILKSPASKKEGYETFKGENSKDKTDTAKYVK